jgi:hypothetical protein
MPGVLLQVRPSNARKAKRTFEIAAKAGFDGLEVDCSGADLGPEKLDYLSVEYGTPVRSLVAPGLAQSRSLYSYMQGDHGLYSLYSTFKPRHVVLAVPCGPMTLSGLIGRLFLGRVMFFKKKYGRETVAVENGMEARSVPLRPIMDIKRLRDFAYQNDVFVNFDTSNCAAAGYDVLLAYDMMAPRVRSVHLSDYGGDRSRQHLIPGSGLLPIGALLTRMKESRFDGPITLELKKADAMFNDDGDLITLYRELIGYIKSFF